MLAVGIIGATVMPHAVYLHSGLTQGACRPANDSDKRHEIADLQHRGSVALAIAGMVNMAMVMMASSAFHAGHSDVAEIKTAYHALHPAARHGAGGRVPGVLLASGVSSSTVGTMAGQMIMQGFVGFRIPIWLRRVVTMFPGLHRGRHRCQCHERARYQSGRAEHRIAVSDDRAYDVHASHDIMGEFANSTRVNVIALAGTVIVLALNLLLVLQTFGILIPGLPAAD